LPVQEKNPGKSFLPNPANGNRIPFKEPSRSLVTNEIRTTKPNARDPLEDKFAVPHQIQGPFYFKILRLVLFSGRSLLIPPESRRFVILPYGNLIQSDNNLYDEYNKSYIPHAYPE